MRIVIDGRMMYWTGIGRYTQALLGELQALDTVNEYLVLMRRADWKLWAPKAANFKRVESNINPYSFSEQTALTAQLHKLKPDLVHFTAPNTPLFYTGRRVVTIHDLTLLDYDTSRGSGLMKAVRGLKRWPFKLVLTGDVRFATALLCDTHFVAEQLVTRLHANPERVFTALLAADPAVAKPEPITRLGKLGRYLFYVGNVYPYKNVNSTLQALVELQPDFPDLKLVVAGKRDEFSAELELLVAELGLSDRVKFAGYVTDGEMVSLYRGAALYVNPSLSEGFGLQGIEAMAQGTPVVAARASCLPEVYGEAAEYFDPYDASDQARAIRSVLTDPAHTTRLIKAGRAQQEGFSWRRMAEQTLAVYQKAGVKRP